MLTSTFIILYALEVVSFTELSIIISIQLLIQIFIDYPTAVFSDLIGHKKLIIFSIVLYCIGFFILALFENNFVTLLFSFILISLAGVQETGAFESWFDTKYRLLTIADDPDRKIYTFLKTRFNAFVKLITALSFIIGGFLVYYFNIQLIFFIQSVLLLFSSIMLLFYLKENKRFHLLSEKLTVKKYVNDLQHGLKFAMKNNTLRYMILGTAIFSACVSIWSNYMLFPLFKTYGKTEDIIGILRGIIWLLQSIFVIIISVVTKKLSSIKRPMLIIILIQSPIMFGGLFLTLNFHPEPNAFNMLSLFIIIITFSFATVPILFLTSLSARIYLDIIPDSSRTGVYSILPTIFSFVVLLFQPIGAYLIELKGFESVLIFLMIIGFVGSLIIGYGILNYKPDKFESDIDIFLPFLESNLMVKELTHLIPESSPKRVKVIVSNIRKELLMTALSDSRISEEEQLLIVKILQNVKEFASLLDNVLADGIVTEEEKKLLEASRDKLWTESLNLTTKDDVLSLEEKRLIFLLAEFLMNTRYE